MLGRYNENDIAPIHEGQEWKRISIVVDSGACENVIDPEMAPGYPARDTPASKAGHAFTAANGDPIPNLGSVRLPIVIGEGSSKILNFCAAEVTKPLPSVNKICSTGHICVFDDEGSYIYNKNSGEYTKIREDSGSYVLDAWVPPSSTFGRQP